MEQKPLHKLTGVREIKAKDVEVGMILWQGAHPATKVETIEKIFATKNRAKLDWDKTDGDVKVDYISRYLVVINDEDYKHEANDLIPIVVDY